MHLTQSAPKSPAPVVLFAADGARHVFPDLLALARYLGRHFLMSGLLNEAGFVAWHPFFEHRRCAVARTDDGEVVTASQLLALLPKPVGYSPRARLPPSVYRRGSVPGIHKTGGHYAYFRSPRTHATLSAARFHEADVPSMRPCQRRLPTRWDDCGRTMDRTWKRHRLHQWKA